MPIQTVEPAFSTNNIAICCITSNHYALYCGVTIASIINHGSPEYNYDILILESDLHERNKEKILSLQALAKEKKIHVSLRFINVKQYIGNREFFIRSHFSRECYYLLFVASVFSKYDKILSLDVDLIARCDVGRLYMTDIGDNWIAGCRDAALVDLILKGKEDESYYSNTLGVDPYHEYFNSGVLLYNLQKWREEHVEDMLMQSLSEVPEPRWLDQCILNKVCNGHVHYLNSAWNRFPDYLDIKSLFSSELLIEHLDDKSIPGILHYIGTKPWYLQNSVKRCDEWWLEARTTPFYGEIIHYTIHEAIKIFDKARSRLINGLTSKEEKHHEQITLHEELLRKINDTIAKLQENNKTQEINHTQHRRDISSKLEKLQEDNKKEAVIYARFQHEINLRVEELLKNNERESSIRVQLQREIAMIQTKYEMTVKSLDRTKSELLKLRSEYAIADKKKLVALTKAQSELNTLRNELYESERKSIVMLRDTVLLPFTWLNMWRCHLGQYLVPWGKTHFHYKNKKRYLREKVRNILRVLVGQ